MDVFKSNNCRRIRPELPVGSLEAEGLIKRYRFVKFAAR
jgi:hypothetical protein